MNGLLWASIQDAPSPDRFHCLALDYWILVRAASSICPIYSAHVISGYLSQEQEVATRVSSVLTTLRCMSPPHHRSATAINHPFLPIRLITGMPLPMV